jgi:hypothetical protein
MNSRPELVALYSKYARPEAVLQLRADVLSQVVDWRWASESMSFDEPFARELYGGPAPRWLSDERADPREHVRHGLDAQGRIVIESGPSGSEQVCLHAPGQRTTVAWHGGNRINSVCQRLYQEGRLTAHHIHLGHRGLDTRYEYEGGQLQRSMICNWQEDEKPWVARHVFVHAADGVLERIDLQYLDADGQPEPGADRLLYLRLPKGETLKTVEARVQGLLEQALPAALQLIPRHEKLYSLLLCYTHEDLPAAWPPFLVWGRESYRDSVLERGEDVRYYLWAPDEIRGMDDSDEFWFSDQALRDACLLHSQLMQMAQSDASAMRVLKRTVPLLQAMVEQAGLPVTDDFVVAHADNTGEIDPRKAMKASLPAEAWALLKQRGHV